MPQPFTLYPDLTARENVDFVASLFGMLCRRRRRRTSARSSSSSTCGTSASRRAGRLSGGMQRRLELACALVHDPALLFLDEPTAGIDPLLRARIWDELHRLRDAGRTLLVTTQYVNEAESCDPVALIADGRLDRPAPPDDLRRQAIGGDIIESRDRGAVRRRRACRRCRSCARASSTGLRQVTVTVDDAGTAAAGRRRRDRRAGGEVASAREDRPSFDEVFATSSSAIDRPTSGPSHPTEPIGTDRSKAAA